MDLFNKENINMHEINNIDKYAIISNGHGVLHTVHNTTGNSTITGQPFMIIGDTEEYVNDLFYSEWERDEAGEITGTPFAIDWIVGHSSEEEALIIDNMIMSVTSFVKFKPIKHPDRDEWANPLQMQIVGAIPDGAIKQGLIQILEGTPNIKNNNEMKSDGWF